MSNEFLSFWLRTTADFGSVFSMSLIDSLTYLTQIVRQADAKITTLFTLGKAIAGNI